MKVEVALVGGAHIHTPNFAKKLAEAPDASVKYVWDGDTSVAESRAQVTGGQVVSDVQQIYRDPAIAAVIICSQTDLHEQLVLDAAAAGKHMFVEKPLGLGADDALRMAEAIERSGVLFQTGYFMRGLAVMQKIRQLLVEGTLGDITRLRLSNCHSGSLRGLFDTEWRWMADPTRAGCGAFGDLGTHVLDLLLWFMQGQQVAGATGCVGIATNRYGDCDEFGEAMLQFSSGAVATLAGSWVDRANPNMVEVSGTNGHLRVTSGDLYITSETLGSDGSEPWKDLPDAWPHAFDLFLQAITGGDACKLVTPSEAARRNCVMQAIYQGAGQQRWVKPDAE